MLCVRLASSVQRERARPIQSPRSEHRLHVPTRLARTLVAGKLACSCSLAVLDPRVGHTMDVLSPFIPVLCHSDYSDPLQYDPKKDLACVGDKSNCSVICTLFKIATRRYSTARWFLRVVKVTEIFSRILGP